MRNTQLLQAQDARCLVESCPAQMQSQIFGQITTSKSVFSIAHRSLRNTHLIQGLAKLIEQNNK